MVLFPLTPKGVDDKLIELYEMTNPLLLVQASAIKTDFKLWVEANFILSPAQLNYVANMDHNAATYYGQQCSFCFVNRLPISLIYSVPPDTLGYAKWTALKDEIEVETNGIGEYNVSGSLTFSISYR